MATRGTTLGWLAGVTWGGYWLFRRVRAARSDLTGQVAIVTGGSRGLGWLIARQLGREGCHVVICARDREELERAREDLLADGADVTTIACDLRQPGDIDGLVEKTLARFGRIDILVNNAGTIEVAPIDALGLEDFEHAMALMFWGTVRATLAVLPHMRARNGGRIVNITSIGGKVAVPHLLPYASAKFATVGFSEGLRAEVAGDGISVTTIVPGLMRTGSHRFAEFKGNSRAEHRWFRVAASTPFLAMSARRAARQIVRAAKNREAERVLGLPARILRLFHDLTPGVAARALSVADRLLPAPPPAEAQSSR